MKTIRILFPILIAFVLSIPSASAESRTWTSKDGTETITGTFVAMNRGMVALRLENGRMLHLPETKLSDEDLAYIAEKTATPSSEEPGKVELSGFAKELARVLISESGRPFKLMKDRTAPPTHYVFYYSASWCPPCRAYTPSLVDFHRRVRKTMPNLEIILVSSDRSEADALAYARNYKMDFPQIRFDDRGAPFVPRNPGSGIPALRLVDADGNSLLTSQDVSRSDFLDAASKIIKGN